MNIKDFDPNNSWAPNGNYFSLPFTAEESKIVILSVAWDVTVSYGAGTSLAPDAIIEASTQLDLYDSNNPDGYKKGIATLPIDETILTDSTLLRKQAVKVIDHLTEGGSMDDESIQKKIRKINEGSEVLNSYVYENSRKWLSEDKIVALVGGDHSTPFGHIKAVAEKFGEIGILHLDAHADLRDAYEGFEYSHASIMYNTIHKIPQVKKLVQVAIRDYCDQELELINKNNSVETYFDDMLQERKFCGESWRSICDEIVSHLPQNVYISFDIDSLTPDNCPSTGTPVPGGLTFAESIYLVKRVVESGRKIVSFDLCEVAPNDRDEWDANVGARILYKLCNLALI